MRVGIVAPPWVTVPPESYGGTEGVIDTLAVGLRDAGHDVRLFATGDSGCPVELFWTFDSVAVPMNQTLPEIHQVQAAYAALEGCDVIHDHTLVGPLWAAARRDVPPVVTTVHGPFTPMTRALYGQVAEWGVTVNAISAHQRSTAPEVRVAAVIHHGVDVARFPLGDGSGGYALFLGRCAPEKGLHDAIVIARESGLRLRIAAKTREPEEREYFDRFVRPHLGPRIEYLGEVTPEQRARELAGATVLLDPIAWPEPFGLVMIEAMACGTPVIAYPSGAAPEIIDDGVTGFPCPGIGAAIARVPDATSLDRADCRNRVGVHFDAERMTRDYEALYRLAVGAVDPTDAPTTAVRLPEPRRAALVAGGPGR